MRSCATGSRSVEKAGRSVCECFGELFLECWAVSLQIQRFVENDHVIRMICKYECVLEPLTVATTPNFGALKNGWYGQDKHH